jgi:hypothetical protein
LLAESAWDQQTVELLITKMGKDVDEVNAARKETADLLRKHGGKTGEELEAEGK